MTINRSTLRFSLLLAVLLLALPWAASAQTAGASSTTEDETNPNYLLTTLDDGEIAGGTLTADVTAQLYGFYGSTGDVVTITMTQDDGSSLDPYIVLLGPLGQVIAKDDDSGKQSLSAQITDAELPANGSYFIIASSIMNISGIVRPSEDDTKPTVEDLSYTISASGQTTPPEDERQYFTSRLELGGNIDGYSTLAEPVYYFTYVVLEAGEVVDINVTSEQFDTDLMVFAPGGDRIAINDDGEGIGTNSQLIGLTLPEKGKYLVFATDVAFPNAGDDEASLQYKGGDFKITFEPGTPLTK